MEDGSGFWFLLLIVGLYFGLPAILIIRDRIYPQKHITKHEIERVRNGGSDMKESYYRRAIKHAERCPKCEDLLSDLNDGLEEHLIDMGK